MKSIKFSTVSTLSLIILSIFFLSCGKTQNINVDHKKWISDPSNCGTYRKDVYKSIIKNRDLYIGILEEDVVNQLGNPDVKDLEKRMKKSVHYQISGYDCDSFSTVKKYLVFEFETFRRVKSIYLIAE